MRKLPVVTLVSLLAIAAEGQMDPSSALLLRGGQGAPAADPLQGGRYTIRPNTDKPGPTPEAKKSESAPATPNRPVEAPKPTAPAASAPAAANNSTVAPTPGSAPTPTDTVTVRDGSVAPASGVGERVRDLVLGGSFDEAENYREQVHSDDPRRNLLDIEIGPTLVYQDSSSNYWYRDYSISSSAFVLGAHVWVTPFFGVRTSLINSMNASISKSVNTRDRVGVDMSWFNAGLVWRSYMGVSRKAPSMAFGIDFVEQQTQPSSKAINRLRTKSSGVQFSLEATMPTSNSFAWQLGGSIIPRVDHSEQSNGGSVSSGTKDETSRIGAWLGGMHTLDRRNQLFWRLEHTIERSQFEGSATAVDPATGTTPAGVSVTTGTTLFTMGYRWGN